MDSPRSRLLRRTPSVYSPISQPSQPVIADDNIICGGTFLNFFAFFIRIHSDPKYKDNIYSMLMYQRSLTFGLKRYFVPGTCMRRSGWYPRARSSWHLQVVSLHLKSWTSPLHSHLVLFALISERSGRRKPPAERSASYI